MQCHAGKPTTKGSNKRCHSWIWRNEAPDFICDVILMEHLAPSFDG